jgi:hypothetical protein
MSTSYQASCVAAIACLALALRAPAQTPVPDQSQTKGENETVIALSPFVVETSEDNGYQASATLAGTRVRTDLKDLASAISVVTQQFLQDTGSKNSADLLVYTPSTEVTGIRGNYSGAAGTAVYHENTITTTTRIRGLDSADNTRDFFLTDIPWDDFNVGRVDVQRGPNSILFGTGSPAGIINANTNDAAFKNAFGVENRFDQYGSVRNSLNFNRVLIDGRLAIRIAALQDDEKFEQAFAFNNSRRYFGALRYDPNLLGKSNHTSLRAKYEQGRVRSNNPRQLPPVDEITPWFKTGTDAYGNPGYDKLIINQFSLTNPNPSGVPLPGGAGGVLAAATYQLGFIPGGIDNYYENTPLSASNAPNAQRPGGTPFKTITSLINVGKGIPDAYGNRVAGAGSFSVFGIPSESSYAVGVGNSSGQDPDGSTFSYPGGAIPGGVFYADAVLTDPTIFNFYKHLLDGPNKKEWQNWKAYNVALDQSFFNDRLAIELAFDHQSFDGGSVQGLVGSGYAINIDVNATYADGTPNPNAGRPYVMSAGTGGSDSATVRNTFRIIPTYELRAADFLGNGKLARILGRHNFTGFYETTTIVQNNVGWTEFATTPDYALDNSPLPGSAFNYAGIYTGFIWTAYVGPNLSGASSAHGANLGGVDTVFAPPRQQSVLNFNSNWNRPTNPSDPNYVDPTAPYTFMSQTGNLTNFVQSQNPANYVGWSQQPVTWRLASNPADYPSLVGGASRTRFRDISQGFTWQGHMLDGDLVPIFGWRKDVITGFQTNSIADPVTGFTSLNYPDNPSSRTDVRGESKSWGGVYHLPTSLVSRLPGDLTISLLYNHSENFKADAQRLSLSGVHIPNASGRTTEYGFLVTALNEKLSLKVNWFKTRIAHAPLGTTDGNSIGGLGSNAYVIADATIWGYASATSLQDGLRGQTPGTNYWDYAADDGFPRGTPAEDAAANNYNLNGGVSPNGLWATRAGVHFAGGQAIIDAWLGKTTSTSEGHAITIAPLPIAQFPNFFSSYNLQPNIDPTIGARTGNLRDSFTAGYDDANGPVFAGGANFGDHQTTVDDLSRGVEFELTAQPIKNWNITLNYSRVKATRENVDPDSQAFMSAMTAFMNGPGGQIRLFVLGGYPLGAVWNNAVVDPYTVMLNQLGHEAPEVSPWRLNIVTTYTFDHGPIKGMFVGGGLREEAGRIIGYKYNPNFVNTNSNDPNYATNLFVFNNPGNLGGLDVNQPFRGNNEAHVDAWIGYTGKLSKGITWRIQLNIRSVGEKDRLMAARINPDGSLALARIVQGMGWQLTNAFDF